MASMTDYLENKVIDHMLRNQAFTPPSTLYLALFTTATTDAAGGTEVVGGSYARQSFAFTAAASGATSNVAACTFSNMPACTVTHAAAFDASTSGNMLLHGPLTNSKVIGVGDSFTIAIGDIDLSMA